MTARIDASLSAAGYVDRGTLSALVTEFHGQGHASNALGAVLARIAGGVWDRFRFTDSRDDFVGEVILHFLSGPLHKADPERNCFSFLTTCAVFYGIKLRDRTQAEQKKFREYQRARLDAHRIYPPVAPEEVA